METKKKIQTILTSRKNWVLIGSWVIFLALWLLIFFHQNPNEDPITGKLKRNCGIALVSVVALVFTVFYDALVVLPSELYHSRKLIWKLAKNDFKKRYAGSYLGALWAMAQPVVTVVMYWIVFDKVFQTRSQMVASGVQVPYVLFLTAGLVPWFFFSEAIMQGMMALLEYNYLVKKVVFNISVLPIIKIIGATFIHLFFVFVLLIVAWAYGYPPSVYTLQLIYYSFCMFMLCLAISYITCSIVVFFRDLAQIISIALQVGMWATPILWEIGMLNNDTYIMLFKINPLVYIVNGYRSSVYGTEWFWQHFYSSTYFWIIVITLFVIGSLLFRKLKVHFADVL